MQSKRLDLKAEFVKRGLTYSELSRLSGVDLWRLSRYTNGYLDDLRDDEKQRIADFLKVEISEIFPNN